MCLIMPVSTVPNTGSSIFVKMKKIGFSSSNASPALRGLCNEHVSTISSHFSTFGGI